MALDEGVGFQVSDVGGREQLAVLCLRVLGVGQAIAYSS
jgi:hypothetical protein